MAKDIISLGKKMAEIERKRSEIYAEIQRCENELSSANPTRSDFSKVASLDGEDIYRCYSVSNWLSKWEVVYGKGESYKGYTIKVLTDRFSKSSRYAAIKDNKVLYKDNSREKVVEYIDTRINALKESPALMKKIGIADLKYNTYACKRYTRFDKTTHLIASEYNIALYKFKMEHPDIKAWKVEISHNVRSLSDSELQWKIRSECEYDYSEGDYVRITADGASLTWGVTQY